MFSLTLRRPRARPRVLCVRLGSKSEHDPYSHACKQRDIKRCAHTGMLYFTSQTRYQLDAKKTKCEVGEYFCFVFMFVFELHITFYCCVLAMARMKLNCLQTRPRTCVNNSYKLFLLISLPFILYIFLYTYIIYHLIVTVNTLTESIQLCTSCTTDQYMVGDCGAPKIIEAGEAVTMFRSACDRRSQRNQTQPIVTVNRYRRPNSIRYWQRLR